MQENRNNRAIQEVSAAGQHLILDCWGAQHLDCADTLTQIIESSALLAGATVLHTHFHTFGGGGGVTGVALLAESHISVHTWPEYDYAAFDIFMCGESQPQLAADFLIERLSPNKVELKRIERGEMAALALAP